MIYVILGTNYQHKPMERATSYWQVTTGWVKLQTVALPATTAVQLLLTVSDAFPPPWH